MFDQKGGIRNFYKVIISVYCLILIIATSGIRSGKHQNNVFSPIPEKSRIRFTEQFNLVLKYEMTQQWDRLYGLLSNPNEDKNTFINLCKRKKSKLIGFTPKSVYYVPSSNKWCVSGCATLQKKGTKKPEKLEAIIYAEENEGNWLFSPVLLVLQKQNGPSPCN